MWQAFKSSSLRCSLRLGGCLFPSCFRGVKTGISGCLSSPNPNGRAWNNVRFGVCMCLCFCARARFILQLFRNMSAPKGVHIPHMRTLYWELCRSLANVTYFLFFFIPFLALPCFASLSVLGMRLAERTFRLESVSKTHICMTSILMCVQTAFW